MKSLPLMREVAKIYLIFDGGREIMQKFSPQSFASQNPAPSSEGAFAYYRGTTSGYDYLFRREMWGFRA